MLKELILPEFSPGVNERQLKFKIIILRHVVFLRCIPQPNRTFCVVEYNGEDSFVVWDSTEESSCVVLYCTAEEKFLRCGIQRKKFVKHPVTVPNISHIQGKPFPLYPITEENLLHGIPQWQKN
jgi:hypothetical protein